MRDFVNIKQKFQQKRRSVSIFLADFFALVRVLFIVHMNDGTARIERRVLRMIVEFAAVRGEEDTVDDDAGVVAKVADVEVVAENVINFRKKFSLTFSPNATGPVSWGRMPVRFGDWLVREHYSSGSC